MSSCDSASDATPAVGVQSDRLAAPLEPSACTAAAASNYHARAPSTLKSLQVDSCPSTSSPAQLAEVDTPTAGTIVQRMGYSFEWTAAHPRLSDLQPLRMRGDDPVDSLLPKLNCGFGADCMAIIAQRAQRHKQTLAVASASRVEMPSPDPVSPSDSDAAIDSECHSFLLQYASVPSWVDWSLVAQGQQLHRRVSPCAMLSLLYSSLIGGFGAPLINQVLLATGRLSTSCPAIYARLMETTLMVMACMDGDERALQPLWTDDSIPLAARPPVPPAGASIAAYSGDGWTACLRVRFLHAQVRRMLLGRQKKPWDTARLGVPINQEDTLVTLFSFSFNMLRCLDRIGLGASAAEREAYIHTWRYVGFLMGVDPALLQAHMCSYDASRVQCEAIALHIILPDESSAALAHHVIEAVTQCFPVPWSLSFQTAIARHLLSSAWTDSLRLPQPSRSQRFRVWLLFRAIALSVRVSQLHPLISRFVCLINFDLPYWLTRHRHSAHMLKFERCKALLRESSSCSPSTSVESSAASNLSAMSFSARITVDGQIGSGLSKCPFFAMAEGQLQPSSKLAHPLHPQPSLALSPSHPVVSTSFSPILSSAVPLSLDLLVLSELASSCGLGLALSLLMMWIIAVHHGGGGGMHILHTVLHG